MTIEDLQELLKAGDATITYLGPWSATSVGESVRWKYACTISPSRASTRWTQGAWTMRGQGKTMEAALDEAIVQLAAFVLKYQPDDR